jgi:deoxyxylulose-5-phosphate synthase
MYLERIDSPEDLKGLSIKELKALATEMRDKIIDVVSTAGIQSSE